MKNETLKVIISVVLSFFLCLFITVLILMITLVGSVGNEKFLQSQVKQSRYGEYLAAEIRENMISLGFASGFSEEFFNSAIRTMDVEADIAVVIHGLYDNDAPAVDFNRFNREMYKKLQLDINESGIQSSLELEDALHYLADACTESYTTSISFPFANTISGAISKVRFFALIGIAVSLAMIGVVLRFIMSIHESRRTKLIRVIQALIGSLLTLGVPTIGLLVSKVYYNIGISSKPLYHLVTKYIDDAMIIILVLLGLILIGSLIMLQRYIEITKKRR